MGQRVLVPPIPDPQGEGRSQTYPRPAGAHQVHDRPGVPHGVHGTVISSLHPGDGYSALDITGAYFHVATYPPHRRYLRFVANRHFQFTVLPAGLYTAHVYPQCLAVVATSPPPSDTRSLYLDDWLIPGTTGAQVTTHVGIDKVLFLRSGLMIHKEEST